MKHAIGHYWNAAWLMITLAATGAPVSANAQPSSHPTPDAGLLASADVLTNSFVEGIARGDFEELYPGVYPQFRWSREVREVGSNGLFRIDYEISGTRPRRGEAPEPLSILLFRPNSRPGTATQGRLAEAAISLSTFRGGTERRSARGVGTPTVACQATRLIEEALVSARFFLANQRDYAFFADTQILSFVTSLADSFPGVSANGGAGPRRVHVYLEPHPRGRADLVLEHVPLLMDMSPGRGEPVRITLASEVNVFHIQFWNPMRAEWIESWPQSNALPALVQVTVGAGPPYGRPVLPHDLSSRIIAPLAVGVTPDLQTSLAVLPNRPGLPRPFPPPPPPFLFAPGQAVDGGGQLADVKPPPEAAAWLAAVSVNGAPGDIELEWLGRSGIELARYILAQESTGQNALFDSLRNKWAGGPGDSNSFIAHVPLENYSLGSGKLSIHIVDQERKFNINTADEYAMRQALSLIGVDAAQMPGLVDSILDWRDSDDNPHIDGAENAYYLGLNPPHFARNGPIDDPSELLWVKGVTPGIFFGPSWTSGNPTYAVGLTDLFTPVSSGRLNINTASSTALQMAFPEFDSTIADAIIRERSGPDGAPATDDDTPFRSASEVVTRVRELQFLAQTPAALQQLASRLTTRSLVFEVTVNVELAGRSSQYTGLLRRNNLRDIPVLYFHRN